MQDGSLLNEARHNVEIDRARRLLESNGYRVVERIVGRSSVSDGTDSLDRDLELTAAQERKLQEFLSDVIGSSHGINEMNLR